MKTYDIPLNFKQYAMLEKMLLPSDASRLAENAPIDGGTLFTAILEGIWSPVEDGWSTPEICMAESADELALLRHLTAQIKPDDPEYFVRRLGMDPEDTEAPFAVRITLHR